MELSLAVTCTISIARRTEDGGVSLCRSTVLRTLKSSYFCDFLSKLHEYWIPKSSKAHSITFSNLNFLYFIKYGKEQNSHQIVTNCFFMSQFEIKRVHTFETNTLINVIYLFLAVSRQDQVQLPKGWCILHVFSKQLLYTLKLMCTYVLSSSVGLGI